MSSIAKASISLSKKDLTRSRVPPVASRNVVFYHKATVGQLTINLLSLTMPSAEIPTATQATIAEISGSNLSINKKNLDLVSSSKGKLIQGLDFVVVDSSTISLIGPGFVSGAEVDEIFVGTINSAPIGDLVVASAKSVDKSYELAVGSTVLNLGREYEVGVNPNEDVGVIKVFVNGVLALRDVDYVEVDSGNGYGTTIQFMVAPVSIPHQVVVDFGVMSITDNNAIGTIESLGGAIKKIADDLSVVAGTSASDYYSASPSEVERRAFGDMVLAHDALLDQGASVTSFTKTKWQRKSGVGTGLTSGIFLTMNNLVIGNTYKASVAIYITMTGTTAYIAAGSLDNGGSTIKVWQQMGQCNVGNSGIVVDQVIFVATGQTLTISISSTSGVTVNGNNSTCTLEELPNHEITTQWT